MVDQRELFAAARLRVAASALRRPVESVSLRRVRLPRRGGGHAWTGWIRSWPNLHPAAECGKWLGQACEICITEPKDFCPLDCSFTRSSPGRSLV